MRKQKLKEQNHRFPKAPNDIELSDEEDSDFENLEDIR